MPNDNTLAFVDARTVTLDCRPAPLCEARPVCAACGGLECLCRPRFFAGQLLTEEDLNRLDHYIVSKNRLHNRHLFGSGVVCGLEVVCTTCDPTGNGGVTVKPGYALSPCGNDIVVCRPELVDICDLINRCRPRAPDDCYQPVGVSDESTKATEDWVLAICYNETPSRGITALRGSSCGCGKSGGAGCSCGSSRASTSGNTTFTSDAGCGCGGGGGATRKTAKTRAAVKAGPVAQQCEPTLTCEGYTFAVYRISDAETKRRDPGALVRRFMCCLQPLLEQLVKFPTSDTGTNGRHDWLVSLISAVREFLITEGLYDCDAAAKLSAVTTPSRQSDNYIQQWSAATLGVVAVIAAVFQKCLCSALLPPCPPSAMSDCVPIATLTVSTRQCRVRHICNIANRRTLTTIPSIEYWLSWLPIFSSWGQAGSQGGALGISGSAASRTLSDLIKRICCTPISSLFDFGDVKGVDLGQPPEPAQPAVPPLHAIGAPVASSAVSAEASASSASTGASLHPFAQLLAESFVGGGREANAATVLLAAMGARNADGTPLASATALQHPAEAMLIHQVVAPALAPLFPLLGLLATPRQGSDQELGRELEQLKATVKKQQEAIDGLMRNR